MPTEQELERQIENLQKSADKFDQLAIKTRDERDRIWDELKEVPMSDKETEKEIMDRYRAKDRENSNYANQALEAKIQINDLKDKIEVEKAKSKGELEKLGVQLKQAKDKAEDLAAILEYEEDDMSDSEYSRVSKQLDKANSVVFKIEQQIEIAKKKRDGMKSIRKHPNQMTIAELETALKKNIDEDVKLGSKIANLEEKIEDEYRKEWEERDEDEIAKWEAETERLGKLQSKIIDDQDDLRDVLEQRKKEQQNANAFGRSSESSQEQLIEQLIAAEDANDEAEIKIVRAKLRRANK